MSSDDDKGGSQNPAARFELLVGMFYGFAIASGLPGGISAIVQPSGQASTQRWIAIFAALVLALSDVLFVYTDGAIFQYRRPGGFARFLLDIAFPIVVFFLLFFPAVIGERAAVSWFAAILFAYFSLAVVYPVLLKWEGKTVRGLQSVALVSFSVCALAMLLPSGPMRPWQVLAADLVSIAVWASYNFSRVYGILQRDHPRPPQASS